MHFPDVSIKVLLDNEDATLRQKMQLSLNSNMITNIHQLGEEKSPLLVVDNFLQDAELLVEHACQQRFVQNSPFYPGVRAAVPISFKSLLLSSLKQQLKEVFQLTGTKLGLSLCQYSIVTTPVDQLVLLQRIPHFDSTKRDALAAVFYLFKENLGGTSFYRHKKTGFETIDDERRIPYFKSLENENGGDNIPQKGYINGDTTLFERIRNQKGIFNRLIVYRRQSLHSASISPNFVPEADPRKGRLTISIFIDCV
ncbi:DUF6445 family protein [Marinimicrobium sp. ARAG 43.8]|uniref:DUF6445 family protein n=1 Tax=Marinimicrobium sp. ARAG 43.8 TaxID=3418719 RepID=UPI003CF74D6A